MEERPAARANSAGAFQPLALGGIPGFAAGFTRDTLTARSLDPDAAGHSSIFSF